MCASSPGLDQRLLAKEQANVKTFTLKSKEIQTAIATFQQILKSCYGPTGHPKFMQNNNGGYMTTTSICSQLLQNLTVSKPVLKLMVAAVQGHLSRFNDAGLFCGLLMAKLVDSCANIDLHPVLCININEHMLQESLQHLDSIKIPVDVADMKTMICIVRSVIETKPLCSLTYKDMEYISTLVLEAFLKAIPNLEVTNSITLSHIETLGVEGFPPKDSCVHDGVLLDANKFMSNPSNNTPIHKIQNASRRGQIRVALYDISMSGDSQNFADVNYELVSGMNAQVSDVNASVSGVSAQDAVLSQMMVVARRLVADEVGLVACQKVIHPTVKKFLRENGVRTLDRLSRIHIAAVQKVTGAQILSTFTPDLPSDAYGYLTSLDVVQMFTKKYLHLKSINHSICTLVLCSRTSAALEELKNVCNKANQTLGLILANPAILPGAGCTETYIASKLRQSISTVNKPILAELGCTRAQYLTVASNFASCIETVATALEHDGGRHISDAINHHRYSIPPGVTQDSDWLAKHDKCACGIMTFMDVGTLESSENAKSESSVCEVQGTSGKQDEQAVTSVVEASTEDQTDSETYNNCNMQVSKEPLVMDCFAVRQNALCVAVETANMVLRIKHTIEDQN